MHFHHIPWGEIVFVLVKLLKMGGIIPGALAAFGVRRLYQKWRQNKAMAGWPATDGTIQSGQVHKQGLRYWVELTYTYYVGSTVQASMSTIFAARKTPTNSSAR